MIYLQNFLNKLIQIEVKKNRAISKKKEHGFKKSPPTPPSNFEATLHFELEIVGLSSLRFWKMKKNLGTVWLE